MTTDVRATGHMERLRLFMRVQAIAIGIYGLAFLLFPAFATDTLFGWEGLDYTWVRYVAVPYLAISWLEWLMASDIGKAPDLVWPFIAVPGLYVLLFLFERIVDSYTGPDSWWWTNFVVVAAFTFAGFWARMTAGSKTEAD